MFAFLTSLYKFPSKDAATLTLENFTDHIARIRLVKMLFYYVLDLTIEKKKRQFYKNAALTLQSCSSHPARRNVSLRFILCRKRNL